MVLESCMILLDNSEYMRNGDYIPTRLEAQHDAANLLVGTKTQSNPESTVGVIAMTGEFLGGQDGSSSSVGAELLISPTDDMGKILGALHNVPIRGRSLGSRSTPKAESLGGSDIAAAVQVANLALKHRRNKNGAQRVVVFVGSPILGDAKSLAKCGRQLKKNNVSIDVIAMGEWEENESKLVELVNAANGSGDSCHLVTIPPGTLPSDVLVTSPIVHGGAAEAAAAGAAGIPAAGGGGGGGFGDFGVDPNMDPELAMALRVSMEEERARQERVTEEPAAEPAAAAPAAADAMEVAEEVSDEDALLQQALAMSMNETNHEDPPRAAAATPAPVESKKRSAEEASSTNTDEEDEAMQLALQMSMQADAEPEGPEPAKGAVKRPTAGKKEGDAAETPQQFQDPQFVNQLLGSLPGVDPNDPAIQNALKNLNPDKKDEKKKDK